MAEYNNPGVRVVQNIINTSTIAGVVTLPTAVVGPLYEVVELAQASSYDPFAVSNQAYSWPDKRAGTIVDLGGVRNGYYDDQRLSLYDYPAEFYVKDGENYIPIDYSYVESVNQDGFEVNTGLINEIDHGDYDFYVVYVNGSRFGYNPDGGVSIDIGDSLDLGVAVSTVIGITSTTVSFDSVSSSDESTKSSAGSVYGDSELIAITPAATSGRVVATLSASDFITRVPALEVGDVAITHAPVAGFTNLQGQVTTSLDGVDGVTFTVSAGVTDFAGYRAKIVKYTDVTYTTISSIEYNYISAITTSTGNIEFATATTLTDNDYVQVTVLKGQVGYVEEINTDADQVTIVVQDTFSDTLSIVDFYTNSNIGTYTAYPTLDVYVTYRANRKDIANQIFSASDESELLSEIGHDSVHYWDGLGFAVRAAINAQPNKRNVIFIPVDVEPDTSTGLPANIDLISGYTSAFESLEATPGYNIVKLDKSAALDDLLTTHVSNMSTEAEGQFRRGFLYQDVPLGGVESSTGSISPGKTSTGIAATALSGNKIIRDDNVAFVTDADVSEGVKVVVLSPAEYAGEYTASGTTTDNDLILNGDSWSLTKEFSVGSVDVNTSAGSHTVTAPSGTFTFVDAGDYIEVTESAVIYRLKVTSVNASGSIATCVDEVPGELDFGTGNSGNGTSMSVIRSWSDTTPVKYYIRPLTKSQIVDKLVASKPVADRRMSIALNYSPYMTVGVDDAGNDIDKYVDPSITLAAIAAKRSGQQANQEATNLFLGAGIKSPKYAFNFFKPSQLNTLASNGFLIVAQDDSNALPYIRDMITSVGITAGLVQFEEMVVAITDFISKILKSTFALRPGQRPQNLTPALLGLRAAQTDIIFKNFVGEDYLVRYNILTVEQDATNKRQTNISVAMVIVVGEKEIKFTLNTSV